MSKSFFGHYLGSKEGIDGIVCKVAKNKISERTIKPITLSIVFLLCWLVAYLNPNILDMISSISGLVLAVILFIMPIYSIYKIKYLNPYKNPISRYLYPYNGDCSTIICNIRFTLIIPLKI